MGRNREVMRAEMGLFLSFLGTVWNILALMSTYPEPLMLVFVLGLPFCLTGIVVQILALIAIHRENSISNHPPITNDLD